MKLMVTDMGESNKHKVLVEYALRFIKDSVGEDLSYFIETDINDGRPLPQLTMEGYRPDVFFELVLCQDLVQVKMRNFSPF